MHDEALVFGANQSNVGIFTRAPDVADACSDVAVICITAGLLHHVGPHRMHVLLARALKENGFSSLRFDLSGIGDSPVREDDLPAIEVPVREINDAIKELEHRGYGRFILFGICSGAIHASKVAADNPSVAGVVLVNSGTDDGNPEKNSQIAAQVYLKHSLWNPRAWKNLFTGRVNYRALVVTLFSALMQKLKGLGKKESGTGQQQNVIQAMMQHGASVLLVLSDRHAQIYALYQKEFDDLSNAKFEVMVYPEADHLFTSLSDQQNLIDRVCRWSTGLYGK